MLVIISSPVLYLGNHRELIFLHIKTMSLEVGKFFNESKRFLMYSTNSSNEELYSRNTLYYSFNAEASCVVLNIPYVWVYNNIQIPFLTAFSLLHIGKSLTIRNLYDKAI